MFRFYQTATEKRDKHKEGEAFAYPFGKFGLNEDLDELRTLIPPLQSITDLEKKLIEATSCLPRLIKEDDLFYKMIFPLSLSFDVNITFVKDNGAIRVLCIQFSEEEHLSMPFKKIDYLKQESLDLLKEVLKFKHY